MELKNLSASLVKAQAAMQSAAKDSKNPHFKSSYSSLHAVIEAVRPPLSENGLGFVQKLHTADGGVSVETVLIHESGEQMSCGILFIPASKQDAQGFGSAVSYGKRYSLQSALGVSSDDDDAEEATKIFGKKVEAAPAKSAKTPPKPVNATVGPDEVTAITKLAMTTKTELSAICTAYGIEHLSSLPLTKVSEVITRLQAKLSTLTPASLLTTAKE